ANYGFAGRRPSVAPTSQDRRLVAFGRGEVGRITEDGTAEAEPVAVVGQPIARGRRRAARGEIRSRSLPPDARCSDRARARTPLWTRSRSRRTISSVPG